MGKDWSKNTFGGATKTKQQREGLRQLDVSMRMLYVQVRLALQKKIAPALLVDVAEE